MLSWQVTYLFILVKKERTNKMAVSVDKKLYGDHSDSDVDDDQTVRASRDDRAVNGSVMKAGAASRAGRTRADRRDTWGGGLRRNTDNESRFFREDSNNPRPDFEYALAMITQSRPGQSLPTIDKMDRPAGPYRPDWPPPGPATKPPVAGRAVPVGFARYVSPVINLGDYQFRRVAAWRVAIPRALPELRVQYVLQKIWTYGPAAAGYVRIGDTMVPAYLDPGSRAALSGADLDGVGGTLGYNSSGLTDFPDG